MCVCVVNELCPFSGHSRPPLYSVICDKCHVTPSTIIYWNIYSNNSNSTTTIIIIIIKNDILVLNTARHVEQVMYIAVSLCTARITRSILLAPVSSKGLFVSSVQSNILFAQVASSLFGRNACAAGWLAVAAKPDEGIMYYDVTAKDRLVPGEPCANKSRRCVIQARFEHAQCKNTLDILVIVAYIKLLLRVEG